MADMKEKTDRRDRKNDKTHRYKAAYKGNNDGKTQT